MNNDNRLVEWRNGGGQTVRIGYMNPHGQRCCGHCGIEGTDHGQYAYKTECTRCGYVYGANGTDLHERLCPNCQGGAPGIRYWKHDEQLPLRFEAKAAKTTRRNKRKGNKNGHAIDQPSPPLVSLEAKELSE